MPFYSLYLYNSHFHTAVTKDLKNDRDGRYFVHSKLFNQTTREILIYIYIYIFQCLEFESHHIHIRNKTCISKEESIYLLCDLSGIGKDFSSLDNFLWVRWMLCVVEILYFKKKSWELLWLVLQNRLKIMKMVHFSAEINQCIISICFEYYSSFLCHWWLSALFGSCLQPQICDSYVCVTINPGVCKTQSVFLSSSSEKWNLRLCCLGNKVLNIKVLLVVHKN